MRYIVRFIVDVKAKNPEEAIEKADEFIRDNSPGDGYDVDVEPFFNGDDRSQYDSGAMNDSRFGGH